MVAVAGEAHMGQQTAFSSPTQLRQYWLHSFLASLGCAAQRWKNPAPSSGPSHDGAPPNFLPDDDDIALFLYTQQTNIMQM